MESSAPLEIWKMSISIHDLVYGTYIIDGNSSSYKNVVKAGPYKGLVTERKEVSGPCPEKDQEAIPKII